MNARGLGYQGARTLGAPPRLISFIGTFLSAEPILSPIAGREVHGRTPTCLPIRAFSTGMPLAITGCIPSCRKGMRNYRAASGCAFRAHLHSPVSGYVLTDTLARFLATPPLGTLLPHLASFWATVRSPMSSSQANGTYRRDMAVSGLAPRSSVRSQRRRSRQPR
jgi:hypothetical protein